jgi:tetratricopeptide (TPR) repeat protein
VGTTELITKPAAGLLTYTAEALDTIYHLTSGHPYFTQLICFELFRLAMSQHKKEVTAEDVLAVLDNAMETGKGGLAWFWDGLPLAERFVLSAIAEVSGEKGTASTEEVRQLLKSYDLRFLGMEVTDAPHILVSWQILKEANREYEFTVELVRRWIRAEHPLANAKRDVENIVPRANRYFANGREAHQAGYLDDAIDDYRRAVTANPFHMRAQLGLAQALHERLLNLLSENNYQVGSHLNQDLDEAQQAFTKAYELDSAATKDSYLDFLDNLATYLYSNNYHQQAMVLAEKAQKLEFSQERADRIGRMAGALAIHRQSYFSWRMARWGAYGSVLVGLLAVILWLMWPSVWPNSSSSGAVITPAAPQEMVVLIADFEGSSEVSLSPAANLEAEWQSTFTHIRFERTNSVVQNEAMALEMAVPLGAVGVLWGDVTTNQITSHFTFVHLANPPTAESWLLAKDDVLTTTLTNAYLVTYAKALTVQFAQRGGVEQLIQLTNPAASP